MTIRGGTGNDQLEGGAGDDVFLWSPGDGSDSLDGGLGSNTLNFSGANINENLAVTSIPEGFQLTRDIAAVTLQVFNIQALNVMALGGDDTISTRPLDFTTQTFDGGTQTNADTLTYDGQGLCTTQAPGFLESVAHKPVLFTNFEAVTLANAACMLQPIPTLGLPWRALLVALLGGAITWAILVKWRSRLARSFPPAS